MNLKESNFDDFRCRNIFVKLVQKNLPDTKIYHKSHTSYQKVYLDVSAQAQSDALLEQTRIEYEEHREEFLNTVSTLLERTLEALPVKDGDLSGDDFVKINFPSPFSWFIIKHILEKKKITFSDILTSGTAIIGVYDEDDFNESFWKGFVKGIVERLERKIDAIAQVYE